MGLSSYVGKERDFSQPSRQKLLATLFEWTGDPALTFFPFSNLLYTVFVRLDRTLNLGVLTSHQ